MIDFKLTPTGDIVVGESKREVKKFNLFFNVNSTPSLKLSFFVKDGKRKIDKRSLKIKFGVNSKEEEPKDFLMCEDLETKRQMIKNALITTKGELKVRDNFGSLIETIRYETLYDKEIIARTKEIVVKAITYVLPLAKVEIEPFYSAYPIFREGYKVSVYEKGTLIYEDIF